MKRIAYSFLIAIIAITGCKKSSTDNTENNRVTPIVIGLEIDGSSSKTNLTKAAAYQPGGPGRLMTTMSDFGNTPLALYAVQDFITQQYWLNLDRVISTTEATVNAESSMINYGTDPKYFPEYGNLAIYSLYPMPSDAESPIKINDDGTAAPSADITIGDSFASQYDILHAELIATSVLEAQNLKLNYNHVMAQLNIAVKRDASAENVKGTITKVLVEGYNKASMPSITDMSNIVVDKEAKYTFVAYNRTSGTALDYESTVLTDGAPLLLFPGKGVVSKVTITVDGNDYYANIDPEWTLAQGQANLLTLNFNTLSPQIDVDNYQVMPWESGASHEENLENNGRELQIKGILYDQDKNTPVVAPTWVDIEIQGAITIRKIAVEEVVSSVFTTEMFNTGIMHDELITITGITIRSGANYEQATIMFDAKLYNNKKTATGKEIVIDHLDSGKIKLRTDENQDRSEMPLYAFNTAFGGFGSGTENDPFEIATVSHLTKVSTFRGTTTATTISGTANTGAYFMQVADIEVGTFNTPLQLNSGGYDGNGYALKNIDMFSTSGDIGLFSSVQSSRAAKTVIQNVCIASGKIQRSAQTPGTSTGSIVGYLSGAVLQNCVNKATVDGNSLGRVVGGIVGKIDGGAMVLNSANFGEVSGYSELGGVVGQLYQNGTVKDSYNVGNIVDKTNVSEIKTIGGVIGKLNLATTANVENTYSACEFTYHKAGDYVGGFIGHVQNDTYPTEFTIRNNYCLSTTASKVGKDESASSLVNTQTTGVSIAELKANDMVTKLNNGRYSTNAPWEQDARTLNSGYPIHKWFSAHSINK